MFVPVRLVTDPSKTPLTYIYFSVPVKIATIRYQVAVETTFVETKSTVDIPSVLKNILLVYPTPKPYPTERELVESTMN